MMRRESEDTGAGGETVVGVDTDTVAGVDEDTVAGEATDNAPSQALIDFFRDLNDWIGSGYCREKSLKGYSYIKALWNNKKVGYNKGIQLPQPEPEGEVFLASSVTDADALEQGEHIKATITDGKITKLVYIIVNERGKRETMIEAPGGISGTFVQYILDRTEDPITTVKVKSIHDIGKSNNPRSYSPAFRNICRLIGKYHEAKATLMVRDITLEGILTSPVIKNWNIDAYSDTEKIAYLIYCSATAYMSSVKHPDQNYCLLIAAPHCFSYSGYSITFYPKREDGLIKITTVDVEKIEKGRSEFSPTIKAIIEEEAIVGFVIKVAIKEKNNEYEDPEYYRITVRAPGGAALNSITMPRRLISGEEVPLNPQIFPHLAEYRLNRYKASLPCTGSPSL